MLMLHSLRRKIPPYIAPDRSSLHTSCDVSQGPPVTMEGTGTYVCAGNTTTFTVTCLLLVVSGQALECSTHGLRKTGRIPSSLIFVPTRKRLLANVSG